MNPRFLAVCLWVIAAIFAATATAMARDGIRDRKTPAAVFAFAVALVIIAVLANAGADLW